MTDTSGNGSTANAGRAIYRVVLAPAPTNTLTGPLGKLSRFLGLDVYGNSLLNRRGLLEMNFTALLLAIIFSFELGAWTLLFNAIFHSELLAFGWATVAAVIPASFFAGAVLVYERSFITTDTTAGFLRLILPVGTRLAVIGASALITAQPVELLIFRGQILQRVHEEGIRGEVIARREQLKKAREKEELNREELLKLETGEIILREDTLLREKDVARQEERDKKSELERNLQRAQRNVNYWNRIVLEREESVRSARRRPTSTPEEIQTLRDSVQQARNNLGGWTNRRDQAQQDLEVTNQRIVDFTNDLEQLKQEFDTQRDEARDLRLAGGSLAAAEQSRLLEWINQLRKVEPGDAEPVAEVLVAARAAAAGGSPVAADDSPAAVDASATNGDGLEPATTAVEPYRYWFPDYDFFEQLRVLRDLRKGFPSTWPGIGVDDAQALGTTYGLESIRPCRGQDVISGGPSISVDPKCDPERWNRHLQQAQQFEWSWRVVYAIAIVIPLLVIATKLLMTPELKAYYSSAHQAAAGNADAIAFESGKDKVDASRPRSSFWTWLAGNRPQVTPATDPGGSLGA